MKLQITIRLEEDLINRMKVIKEKSEGYVKMNNVIENGTRKEVEKLEEQYKIKGD